MPTLSYHQIESDLVPSPRGYRTLLPDSSSPDLPLLLLLHGGGGSSDFLAQMQPTIERAWQNGTLPSLAVATLDAERSFYLDYEDGSQRWESFLIEEWLPALRETLPVGITQSHTLIAGISMGGHGTTRIGFRYPELFCAMAAMEPAVMPAHTLQEVPPQNLAFQSRDVLEQRYGTPPDAYWNENNPNNLAIENQDRIRAAEISIYLEVGTEDFLLLNEGTEFLHQVLVSTGIQHEYRAVLGANHVGRTVAPRFEDMLGFLGRCLTPDEPDPVLEQIAMSREVRGQEASS